MFPDADEIRAALEKRKCDDSQVQLSVKREKIEKELERMKEEKLSFIIVPGVYDEVLVKELKERDYIVEQCVDSFTYEKGLRISV